MCKMSFFQSIHGSVHEFLMLHGSTSGPIATFIADPVGAGSRSSALTLAVAMHPRACVMTCIDERSLGFWAVGHARATG